MPKAIYARDARRGDILSLRGEQRVLSRDALVSGRRVRLFWIDLETGATRHLDVGIDDTLVKH